MKKRKELCKRSKIRRNMTRSRQLIAEQGSRANNQLFSKTTKSVLICSSKKQKSKILKKIPSGNGEQ